MENTEKNHTGLKVIGLLCAIIAGIIILSVGFSKSLLPIMRYNSAQSLAQQGNYAEAAMRLYNVDYKDSKELFGEYALTAGKIYLENNDAENASKYLSYALYSENKAAVKEAEEIFNHSGD